MHSRTGPIFIIGNPNSGTSMLQKVLARHPKLCSTPLMDYPDDLGAKNHLEVQDMAGAPDVMRHTLGKETFRLWALPEFKGLYYVTEADWTPEVDRIVKSFMAPLWQPGKRLVVKSPSYTMRARLLQRIFPDSSFIALVRNGYAVAEGIRRKRRLDPERQHLSGQVTSITQAALQWQYGNTVLVSHQSFLKRILFVRYEDLVDTPDAVFDRVLDFLGLPGCDVAVPAYERGLNDKQIARLTVEEIEIVGQYCWPMLRHFLY